MNTHIYFKAVDGICFIGKYTIENEDEEDGYKPIFTVCTIMLANKGEPLDLMLVIDPRVVQEIEQGLLDSWLWDN
jgi:hypothetical protein